MIVVPRRRKISECACGVWSYEVFSTIVSCLFDGWENNVSTEMCTTGGGIK